MLALPVLAAQPTAAPETASGALLVAVVVGLAAVVLLTIALDLRRLRRTSRLRAIHGVIGAAFAVMVVGGALAMTFALGNAPSATADQPLFPAAVDQELTPAPEPESIDTGDVTDPATDIQLPTLPVD